MGSLFIHYLVPIKSIQMSKHVHNCIDEILDRITIIEKRLDEMEKMV